MNYEADIEIDEQALDAEWLDHSRRMFTYCQHAAEVHRDMDLSKENVDFVRAQIDKLIRQDPSQFGIPERVTEGSIQSTILTETSYQRAVQEYLQKKYEYEVAQAAVRAFDHRKSALENLVRLHGQSYFAGPSAPHDLSESRRQRDEARRERDTRVQERVRLRRRS